MNALWRIMVVFLIMWVLGCMAYQYQCDTDMECYLECVNNGDSNCE